MNIQTLTYLNAGLAIILLLAVIWQFYKLSKLDRVRKEFFASGLKKDFEQILVDQNRGITKLNQEILEMDESLSKLYKENRKNLQKIGFVRYNPFDDSGGNISFCLALLNDADDGIVISSLHGREGTRVYSKEIKSGLSESKLTEEEITAIKEAR
jgi:hypothetical protein